MSREPVPVLERIEVALLPAEALAIEAECYIVVDVLRATSTIAALFANGLRQLTCVDDAGRARKVAAEQGALLFGEVDGLPPPEFDYGNSPVDAAAAAVRGEHAVLFTTNGTRALCALAGRGTVLSGALANATAVAEAAMGYRSVAVVCAGTALGTRFTFEDLVAAGVIARGLSNLAPGAVLGDAAHLALRTVAGAGDARALEALLRQAAHGATLDALGLAPDIAWAARQDSAGVAPEVVEWGPGRVVLE